MPLISEVLKLIVSNPLRLNDIFYPPMGTAALNNTEGIACFL